MSLFTLMLHNPVRLDSTVLTALVKHMGLSEMDWEPLRHALDGFDEHVRLVTASQKQLKRRGLILNDDRFRAEGPVIITTPQHCLHLAYLNVGTGWRVEVHPGPEPLKLPPDSQLAWWRSLASMVDQTQEFWKAGHHVPCHHF